MLLLVSKLFIPGPEIFHRSATYYVDTCNCAILISELPALRL